MLKLSVCLSVCLFVCLSVCHTHRLAEGQQDLAAQHMEEVGWSGAVHHNPVGVIELVHSKVLRDGLQRERGMGENERGERGTEKEERGRDKSYTIRLRAKLHAAFPETGGHARQASN